MERLHHPGGIVLLYSNFQTRVTTEALADIISINYFIPLFE